MPSKGTVVVEALILAFMSTPLRADLWRWRKTAAMRVVTQGTANAWALATAWYASRRYRVSRGHRRRSGAAKIGRALSPVLLQSPHLIIQHRALQIVFVL